jgi:hypothetical protein
MLYNSIMFQNVVIHYIGGMMVFISSKLIELIVLLFCWCPGRRRDLSPLSGMYRNVL